MDVLEAIGRWISENESLLSGLAAMIVVSGVVWSVLGGGLNRLRDRPGGPEVADLQATPPSSNGIAGQADPITLQDLTKPVPQPIRFADSEGVRIAWIERGRGRWSSS